MPESNEAHPKSSPSTLTLNFTRQWSIVRPRLYRHMEAKYVDSFLRLSSFEQFAKHPDEKLRNTGEGKGVRYGLGSQASPRASSKQSTWIATGSRRRPQ